MRTVSAAVLLCGPQSDVSMLGLIVTLWDTMTGLCGPQSDV